MQRLTDLLQAYYQGTISEAEMTELAELVADPGQEQAVKEVLQGLWEHERAEGPADTRANERIFAMVTEKIRSGSEERIVTPAHRVHFIRRFRWAAAAIFILALAGVWMLIRQPKIQDQSQAMRFKNDLPPGRSGAVLTLEGKDGKSILLDTAANGSVLGHFVKGDSSVSVQTTTVQYASLSTPVAHTEKLRLADGTIVYLNANSSVRFPTVFNGTDRMVEITGEAYFEVVHNGKMPFRVKLPNGTVVEDIGTEFNINTYANEATINTTVAEGSVQVSNAKNQAVLKAGMQAKETAAGTISVNNDADLLSVTAWKDGRFYYDGATIETILQQAARWYGFEVEYKDKVPDGFVVKLPRTVPLSELLKALEGTGQVRFTIENKKITVYK